MSTAVHARSQEAATPATPIRSRNVRKILKLEGRVARLLVRYERALACAKPWLRRAQALRREARAVELS